MKQLFTVFKFEIAQKLKEKSFYISLIITALIFFGITFAPSFFMDGEGEPEPQGQLSEISDDVAEDDTEKSKIGLLVSGNVEQVTIDELKKRFDVTMVDSENQLMELVKNGELERGLVLQSDLEAKLYSKDGGLLGGGSDDIEDVMKNSYLTNILLKQENISLETYQRLQSVNPNIQIENLGKNGFVGYALSYLALMFLYFSILMNGQSIATNVAKEKSSRTMEILVTNVKPNNLIVGKVLAGTVATMIQIVVVAIATSIGILMKPNPMVLELIGNVFNSVAITDLILLFVFALTGVIMYFFLFAAFGSLVSRVEDLAQALTPVTMIIIIAFMVPMSTMSAPDSFIMDIVTLVPFSSPLAIFPRYLMTTMELSEILLSYGILFVTTIILAMLSFKIYRQGTLNYGNKLNIWKVLTTKNK